MASPLKIGTEAFLRAGGFVYLVEVLGIAQNAIWVSFPDIEPPAPGTGVELDIDDGDVFTRFHAHVAASAASSPGIMLERSETASHRKQRREYRVPYDSAVDVFHEPSQTMSTARIVDVSGGGVRLASNESLGVGDRLKISVEWPNEIAYEYPARVLYARPPKLLSHTYGYGVRLHDSDAGAKRALTEFLSREIARRYPEELRALYPRTPRSPKSRD